MSAVLLTADIEIDLRGESCPYPLMDTLEVLAGMSPHQLLKVITDCPSSFRNIPEEVQRRHYKLAAPAVKSGAEYVFYIYAS